MYNCQRQDYITNPNFFYTFMLFFTNAYKSIDIYTIFLIIIFYNCINPTPKTEPQFHSFVCPGCLKANARLPIS